MTKKTQYGNLVSPKTPLEKNPIYDYNFLVDSLVEIIRTEFGESEGIKKAIEHAQKIIKSAKASAEAIKKRKIPDLEKLDEPDIENLDEKAKAQKEMAQTLADHKATLKLAEDVSRRTDVLKEVFKAAVIYQLGPSPVIDEYEDLDNEDRDEKHLKSLKRKKENVEAELESRQALTRGAKKMLLTQIAEKIIKIDKDYNNFLKKRISESEKSAAKTRLSAKESEVMLLIDQIFMIFGFSEDNKNLTEDKKRFEQSHKKLGEADEKALKELEKVERDSRNEAFRETFRKLIPEILQVDKAINSKFLENLKAENKNAFSAASLFFSTARSEEMTKQPRSLMSFFQRHQEMFGNENLFNEELKRFSDGAAANPKSAEDDKSDASSIKRQKRLAENSNLGGQRRINSKEVSEASVGKSSVTSFNQAQHKAAASQQDAKSSGEAAAPNPSTELRGGAQTAAERAKASGYEK
jgi:hypothetical protein